MQLSKQQKEDLIRAKEVGYIVGFVEELLATQKENIRTLLIQAIKDNESDFENAEYFINIISKTIQEEVK